ncbi:AIPR family protein [Bifidobacterium aquikefiricola]|uniref:AIPR family protein n=1 Tax=Bifidobacterium aquikefiricola TaxID=3059038 RepID=A0AB39U806_9BIFI
MGISLVTGENSIDLLADSIIDSSYCNIVENSSAEDGGIDAVFVDDTSNHFYLFNFKYRDKKPGKQHESDIAYPFLHSLNGGENNFSGKVAEKFQYIKKLLDSNTIWQGSFIQISNDFQPLLGNSGSARTLEPTAFLSTFPFLTEEPRSIVLDDFLEEDKSADNNNATITIGAEKVIPYKEDIRISDNNFVVILSLFDLLRITSDKKELRNDVQFDDSQILSKTHVDVSVLDANVRGWLGPRKKFHKKVFETLDNEPSKFFIYNNGITMVAERVVSKKFNKDKFQIKLENFQIVNGGQTIRNLSEWIHNQNSSTNSDQVNILVRIFETGGDKKLANDIARYTNSQSAVNAQDLKSVDTAQVKIREYLFNKQINYIRKRGDYTEKINVNFKQTITKEELAGALYTLKGRPEIAIGSAGRLFEDANYDEIFGAKNEKEDNYDLASLPELITAYLSYKNAVKASGHGTSRAHILYGLFLREQQKNCHKKPASPESNIKIVQKVIDMMSGDSSSLVNRPWMRDDFKQQLLDQAKLGDPKK